MVFLTTLNTIIEKLWIQILLFSRQVGHYGRNTNDRELHPILGGKVFRSLPRGIRVKLIQYLSKDHQSQWLSLTFHCTSDGALQKMCNRGNCRTTLGRERSSTWIRHWFSEHIGPLNAPYVGGKGILQQMVFVLSKSVHKPGVQDVTHEFKKTAESPHASHTLEFFEFLGVKKVAYIEVNRKPHQNWLAISRSSGGFLE